MVWPFSKRRKNDGPTTLVSEALDSEDPEEPPSEEEELAIALLKRAYAASIGRSLGEEFVVHMTDEEEEKEHSLDFPPRVFHIACWEAHRWGLQVESAFNGAYTFSRI